MSKRYFLFAFLVLIINWINPNVATAQSPGEVYHANGLHHREMRKFETAILQFTKAIEVDSSIAIYYLDRGITYQYQREYYAAISDFKSAIQRDGSYEAYARLSQVYVEMNEFDSALVSISFAITSRPDDARLFIQRAIIHMKKGDAELAEQDFDTGLAMQPEEGNFHYNKAIFLLEQQDSIRAAGELELAIQYSPDHYKALVLSADIFRNHEDYDEAMQRYNRAIEAQPSISSAWLNRGLLKFYLKDKQEGCNDLSKAALLGNNNARMAIDEYCSNRYKKLIK